MEEFTLILADGTEISGIVNGNNYITQQSVSSDDLDDVNLIGSKLNGSEMANMTCCNFWEEEDGTHMVFRQKTSDELERESINAKLEYLAMMTDVDLD